MNYSMLHFRIHDDNMPSIYFNDILILTWIYPYTLLSTSSTGGSCCSISTNNFTRFRREEKYYIPCVRHRQSCTQCGLKMTSHNSTRNAHDVLWKWIGWQRQRRTCYKVQYHNFAWRSIYECLFVTFEHNKNTSPPTILEMYVSLPALIETCFEVNTLGEFAPDRSVCTVGEGIEGGGCTCCPCNVILARPHWVHDCRRLWYKYAM